MRVDVNLVDAEEDLWNVMIWFTNDLADWSVNPRQLLWSKYWVSKIWLHLDSSWKSSRNI